MTNKSSQGDKKDKHMSVINVICFIVKSSKRKKVEIHKKRNSK